MGFLDDTKGKIGKAAQNLREFAGEAGEHVKEFAADA